MLIDFGLSEKIDAFSNTSQSQYTPYYCAPEIRRDINGKIGKGNRKSDVYMVGLMLLILFLVFICNRPLPKSNSSEILFPADLINAINKTIPTTSELQFNQCVSLFQSMTKRLPHERPPMQVAYFTLHEIIQSHFTALPKFEYKLYSMTEEQDDSEEVEKVNYKALCEEKLLRFSFTQWESLYRFLETEELGNSGQSPDDYSSVNQFSPIDDTSDMEVEVNRLSSLKNHSKS